jgi:hypothetical protein
MDIGMRERPTIRSCQRPSALESATDAPGSTPGVPIRAVHRWWMRRRSSREPPGRFRMGAVRIARASGLFTCDEFVDVEIIAG